MKVEWTFAGWFSKDVQRVKVTPKSSAEAPDCNFPREDVFSIPHGNREGFETNVPRNERFKGRKFKKKYISFPRKGDQ